MSVARLKIIVAEDSEVQRLYLCSLIDAFGHEAIPAEDGLVALDLVKTTGAQIVISDFQMPNLNGVALTRKIRELGLEHYVHIIMITGNDENDVRKEALEAGVDDFLTKGGGTANLKARINTATRLINHADELAERTRILKESNDRIQDDLRAAAAAQRQLLPDIDADILGFRIASAFVPSAIVSGDMFGCFALADDKLGFYAVDVSGHGVHASLLSVAIGHLITPEYFRTKALGYADQPNPAALVADLNERFSAADNDEYFTMFCGVIDTATGQLDYCQAGYPSPYYVRPDGSVEPVGDGGFPVGMIAALSYDNSMLQFKIGGALVICSDAASEAESTSSEPFGTSRVSTLAAALPEIGVEKTPEMFVRTLNDWRDGAPLEDDLTVVALKRTEFHDSHNHI